MPATPLLATSGGSRLSKIWCSGGRAACDADRTGRGREELTHGRGGPASRSGVRGRRAVVSASSGAASVTCSKLSSASRAEARSSRRDPADHATTPKRPERHPAADGTRDSARANCASVVPLEPCRRCSGADILADAHKDDLEPVGIAHADAVEVCVAVALVGTCWRVRSTSARSRSAESLTCQNRRVTPASPRSCRAFSPISRMTTVFPGLTGPCSTASAPSFQSTFSASTSR